MVLDDAKIKSLIEKPYSKALIDRAKQLFKSHRLHIKGVGVDDFLARIEQYENEAQHILRKRLAKPATVPIYGKELAPFSKAFSAQGFSRYYNFKLEDQKSDFKNYLMSDLGDGMNMSQWMRYWLEKVNYDSTGLMMVELPSESEEELNPYICFKSINDIHDIDFEGNNIEYVILKWEHEAMEYENVLPNSGIEYFRVIDAELDRIYKREDGVISEMLDKQLKNNFGYVPAIAVSNQKDSISEARTSYVWQSIGLADEYLLDASIHSISKKLHGFPIKYMRQQGCKVCSGSGMLSNPRYFDDNSLSQTMNCSGCNGTGYSMKSDVSDVIIIPTPTQGEPDVLPVAGYVQPDIATLAEQRTESDWLRIHISKAIWTADDSVGTGSSDKTATGVVHDVQSVHDKLNIVSDNAQEVEKFLTDTLALIRYGSDYIDSAINYGRRYFVRSADEIERLYEAARTANLPTHLLDAYIEELIYVKFGNDPMELQRQLKLNELEPFIHLSAKDVKDLGVSQSDLFLKIYFNDYIEMYEREGNSISFSSTTDIAKKLAEYNKAKVDETKPIIQPIIQPIE